MSSIDRSASGFTVPAAGGDISRRQAALLAGIALLLMAVLAPIANFGVLSKLIVPGDANTTAQNIAAALGLFRLAIGSLFAVVILDVVVAWALYIFFQPVNRVLSLLAAILRIVYATMFGIAVTNLMSALRLLQGASFRTAVGVNLLSDQAMGLLGAYQSGWDLALIVFGVHLIVVGALVGQTDRRLGLKILGILVIAAGLGYIADSAGRLLLPADNLTISTFTFVGELLLMFWLLWKGIGGVTPKCVSQRKSNERPERGRSRCGSNALNPLAICNA
jgi:hypothetical protein